MPTVPFIGPSPVLCYAVEEVMAALNFDVLFKSRWKMASGGDNMLKDFLMDDRFLASIEPQAVYGYFPVYREENRLVLNESVLWEFPESGGKRLCDHFKTKDAGGGMIPLTAVTIGHRSVDLSRELYANNDYAEYFLYYGLAAECTETIAAMLNARIEEELGGIRTQRRSFGYPACPDLSYQRSLLDLVKAGRIGISLNAADQLVPEFSTTAIIVHSKLDK